MAKPETPPAADLIKTALKRRRITARRASELAGLSEARWYQIMRGSQTVAGKRVPVVAPPETLARMAKVAGVTDVELEGAGYPEAAEELRALSVAEAAPAFSDEESWVLQVPRVRKILTADLPLDERIQFARDAMQVETDRELHRVREQLEHEEQGRKAG